MKNIILFILAALFVISCGKKDVKKTMIGEWDLSDSTGNYYLKITEDKLFNKTNTQTEWAEVGGYNIVETGNDYVVIQNPGDTTQAVKVKIINNDNINLITMRNREEIQEGIASGKRMK